MSVSSLPPSPLTRPAGSCPAPICYLAARSALSEYAAHRARGRRGPRTAQLPGCRTWADPLDGPSPISATRPRAVCRVTLAVGLTSGSAVFTSNPWWDHWSLPGGSVLRSGGCSRPRPAGTIAGSRVSGGLRRWLLFGRVLPPPPTTRVQEPRSRPSGDGFTGCLFASGFYFRGQAPRTATCKDWPDSCRGDPAPGVGPQ